MTRERLSNLWWIPVVSLGAGLLVWLIFNRTPDPKFEDEPLSYWLTPPHQSATAVRAIGTNGLPLLVSYMGRQNGNSPAISFQSRALFGFQVLGPAAAPAIPGLINLLDHGGYAAPDALLMIGSQAVPAMTNWLAKNRHPTRKTRAAYRNCFRALSRMGTNAEPAIPEIVAQLPDYNAAAALATVGRHQTSRVVPALIGALTNASEWHRPTIAHFLGEFGTEAKTAIPYLLEMAQHTNYYEQIESSIAIRRIAPEIPGALQPIVQLLLRGNVNAQSSALSALHPIGSNATEVLPAVITVARKKPQLRQPAFRCIEAIGKVDGDVLDVLTNGVIKMSSGGGYELETLVHMSKQSSNALAAALSINTTRQSSTKKQLELDLQVIAREHPDLVMACLENGNDDIRYRAIRLLHFSPPDLGEKALIRACSDKNARNRTAAEEELVSLFPELARKLGLKVLDR